MKLVVFFKENSIKLGKWTYLSVGVDHHGSIAIHLQFIQPFRLNNSTVKQTRRHILARVLATITQLVLTGRNRLNTIFNGVCLPCGGYR